MQLCFSAMNGVNVLIQVSAILFTDEIDEGITSTQLRQHYVLVHVHVHNHVLIEMSR